MTEFTASCIDNITGKEMILSDCSYNAAYEWLREKLKKKGLRICGIGHNHETGITELYTGDPNAISLNLGRKFFYDETRGLLLGE